MHNDKLLHFALGIIACIAACAGMLIYITLGLGPLLAFASTTVGIAYEGNQYIRKEGQVDVLDALATSLPGWLMWACLFFF